MDLIAGGPSYKWKGNNIRTINIDGFNCATMPRKDSFVNVPIIVKPNNKYKISFVAKNNGGDGRINIDFYGADIIVDNKNINIRSSNFLEYNINIFNNEAKGNIILKIIKNGLLHGNIIIREVKYEKVIILPTIEAPEVDSVIERQNQIGEHQANISKGFRDAELKTILATRGNSMAIIGGNGYRWKGKSIRSIFKDGITCVELIDKDSFIMVPVSITGEANYKISITASKGNGDGVLLVNFFGGKNFDGKASSINISSIEMKDYPSTIQVPVFPPNLPMYLRLWRPENASGKICIKIVQYNKLGVINNSAVVEKAKRIKSSRLNKKQKKPNIPINEDFTSMKFRPYNLKNNNNNEISKVLICSVDDVPKVSIITPTRDGIELLKKCYEALSKNTAYPNWEWVIGDSVSADGTAEYIKNLQDNRIKLIERGTVEGSFSSINNELVEFASGEYYLFLNNDTEPQPFWLYEMMSKIVHNPDIGIVGAKLMYNQQKIQHAGICFIPQGPANIGHSVLESFPKNFATHDRYYQAVTGACMLMRAEDFKAIGGFDTGYYFCYEDVDLCLKIRKQLNKKVLYAANAIVIHTESVTQKKHRTAGIKQQEGIKLFKERWMKEITVDFGLFQRDIDKDTYKVNISFVTCVNNMKQYINYIVGSLFKNKSNKNYEIIPILNFGNPYSASQALNLGISKARGDIIVLCHQDVIFYENWINMLFDRILEIEFGHTKKWGVLGTAGITIKDDTIGVVHNVRGKIQWQSTKRNKVGEVQTVDEHCMVIKKSSGLKFDEGTFNGFHFYGPDICLLSIIKGYKNFGILCPLIHDSASGSLASGRDEFMRLLSALAKKWKSRFDFIRTPTSVIREKSIRTFVKFRS